MTTPQEPAPDTETYVTAGDVTEHPTKPDEDGTNSSTHEAEESPAGDTVPEVPQGPQETDPTADKDGGDESFDSTENSD